jgi:hypothetical protein
VPTFRRGFYSEGRLLPAASTPRRMRCACPRSHPPSRGRDFTTRRHGRGRAHDQPSRATCRAHCCPEARALR